MGIDPRVLLGPQTGCEIVVLTLTRDIVFIGPPGHPIRGGWVNAIFLNLKEYIVLKNTLFSNISFFLKKIFILKTAYIYKFK